MSITDTVKRDGKVALKQIGNTQRPVPIQIGEVVYQASPQHNIWLLWVDEEVTEELLQKKIKSCDCNGGAYKPLFKLASTLDVSLWDTGDRPR